MPVFMDDSDSNLSWNLTSARRARLGPGVRTFSLSRDRRSGLAGKAVAVAAPGARPRAQLGDP